MNNQKMTDEEVCQIIMCQYPEEESVDGSINQDLETSSSPSVPAPRVKIIHFFLLNTIWSLRGFSNVCYYFDYSR